MFFDVSGKKSRILPVIWAESSQTLPDLLLTDIYDPNQWLWRVSALRHFRPLTPVNPARFSAKIVYPGKTNPREAIIVTYVSLPVNLNVTLFRENIICKDKYLNSKKKKKISAIIVKI